MQVRIAWRSKGSEKHLQTGKDFGGFDTMKYLVLIEKENNNYSAHVPDLPGCVAAPKIKRNPKRNPCPHEKAIAHHLELLKESKHEIPQPHTESAILEILL